MHSGLRAGSPLPRGRGALEPVVGTSEGTRRRPCSTARVPLLEPAAYNRDMRAVSEASEAPPSTIVVGIDGSLHSEQALHLALEIAAQRRWLVHLVTAFRVPNIHLRSVELLEQDRADSRREAVESLEPYVALANEKGVETTWECVEGDTATALITRSRNARLAVVGKRGRNRFAGRFLGSVSSKLAAHSRCPTLIVPARWEAAAASEMIAPHQERPEGPLGEEEPISLLAQSPTAPRQGRPREGIDEALNFDSQVVAGLDLGATAHNVAIAAADYAMSAGLPLTLLAAAPLDTDTYWYVEFPQIQQRYTDQLTGTAREVSQRFPSLTVHWKFFDGSPAGTLAEATRTARLVVAGTRGHGGFAGLLLGSVSQALLQRAAGPVLIVPTATPPPDPADPHSRE